MHRETCSFTEFSVLLSLNKQLMELAIFTPCHPAMNTFSFNDEKCKCSLNIKHYFLCDWIVFAKASRLLYLMIHSNQPTKEHIWHNGRFTPKQIKSESKITEQENPLCITTMDSILKLTREDRNVSYL